MDQALYEQAVALRHQLHAHPELSNQEQGTKARLMDFLRENTSRLEIVDRGAWFYAVCPGRPEGRRIAFQADMDALPIDETITLPYGSQTPGVSHKCGHDGHSATLAAFAVAMDHAACKNTLYFIFQHAEETADGAKVCAELLTEESISEVFGYHNEPGRPLHQVLVRHGVYQCASVGMSLYFHGAPSHASDPFLGRNPAFAIARLVTALPALYRAERYEGLTLATVIQIQVGEAAFGTSPGEGVLRVTLRAEQDQDMERLRRELDQLAYRLSAEYGLEYRAEYCDSFPENRSADESVDKIIAVCKKLGLAVQEMERPKRGSEDFGYYTQRTKGAFINIGAGDVTAHHTVTYDFPDEIMATAFDLFRALAETD